ncbi:MAG: GNAT family N-acetyltransferase [Halanaerobiales bacterium]|nr:GNAT family N-acetyltransferase [Halanaerobiales bacterium]
MIIRKAKSDDLNKINEIYNQAVKELNASMDYKPISIAESKNWFKKHQEGSLPIIVSDIDDNLVGWAALSKWSDKKGYKYTVENSVYVKQSYWERGIGDHLLANLILEAKKRELKNILANITEGNERSIRLHQKHGFEKVGSLKNVAYKFNTFYDINIYQLIID